jgi:hypothetical protein
MTSTPISEPTGRVVLFVTYTMLTPVVGGAFIRALRLAVELQRRGWTPVICNHGPLLDDPKITASRGLVRIVQLDREAPGFDSREASRQFEAFEPRIIVFGETPFDTMKVFYRGARLTGRPFVLLDQYYNDWLMPRRGDADLILLYGLRCFWPEQRSWRRPYAMTPPFIEAVTPKAALWVSARQDGAPCVTLMGYDPGVLRKGVELLAPLRDRRMIVVAVSPDPARARRLLSEAGIEPAQTVTLPLQNDADAFGLIRASNAAVISNGFLQVMEALALACPVVCIDRDGAGIEAWTIDERFKPYVSIGEDTPRQRDRLVQWLSGSPFPSALHESLQAERDGARFCADRIEALVAAGGGRPTLRQRARQLFGRVESGTGRLRGHAAG